RCCGGHRAFRGTAAGPQGNLRITGPGLARPGAGDAGAGGGAAGGNGVVRAARAPAGGAGTAADGADPDADPGTAARLRGGADPVPPGIAGAWRGPWPGLRPVLRAHRPRPA